MPIIRQFYLDKFLIKNALHLHEHVHIQNKKYLTHEFSISVITKTWNTFSYYNGNYRKN